MSSVVYTFYLENAGEAVLGATPTFDKFINLTDSAINPVGGVVYIDQANEPTIQELEGGFYYFVFDWDVNAGGASSYLVKIKCGEDDQFHNPEQQFIIMRLDKNDSLSNMVNAIETSSDTIKTATSTLLKSVNRLLEVEQGTWKIEFEGGLYYLNLYPTTDNDQQAANPLYDTSLTVGEPFAKYLLQDEHGSTTPTNPFRRIQDTITALPNGD